MMGTLADNRQTQAIGDVVSELDEAGFRDMLDEITQQSQRFLEATALARGMAFQSRLEQALFSFTAKAGQLLDAERASLFLVDHSDNPLVQRVAEDLPDDGEVRIPIGSGIAGDVAAASAEIVNRDAVDENVHDIVDQYHQPG